MKDQTIFFFFLFGNFNIFKQKTKIKNKKQILL